MKVPITVILLLVSAGCMQVREEPSAPAVRHLFAQSPQRAVACVRGASVPRTTLRSSFSKA
jgi:hypothetical protein